MILKMTHFLDVETCRNLGKEVVEWAASGGKNDPSAGSWYYNMPSIAGVKYGEATLADFQRLYYCAPPGKDKFCGVPPCTGCSREPCNDCFAGHQMYASMRPGCDGNNRGLGCVPPKSAMGDLASVNKIHIHILYYKWWMRVDSGYSGYNHLFFFF